MTALAAAAASISSRRAAYAGLRWVDAPGDQSRLLSYRGDALSRVAAETRARLEALVEAGRLELLLGTKVKAIELNAVVLEGGDGELRRPNDLVVVQIGGTVPTAFLRKTGVLVDVHRGRVIEAGDEGEDEGEG